MSFTGFSIGGLATKRALGDGRFEIVDLELREISAVDVPAQEGAIATIAKRLTLASVAIDKADTDTVLAAAAAPAPTSTPAPESKLMDPTQMEARIKELEAQAAALEAENAALKTRLGEAEKTAELPVEEQKFAKSLTGGERTAYLAKSATDRAALAQPIHKSADGTLYFRGEEKLVELAKRTDAAEDKAITVELTKRATDRADLGALPTTPGEKVEALKAFAGLPETVRTTLEQMLKSGNAAAVMLQKNLGTTEAPDTDATPVGVYMAELKKFAAEHKLSPERAAPQFMATADGKRLFDATQAR